MPCGYGFCADRIGQIQKAVELDKGVAEGTRDGRTPGKIFIDERLDHALFKLAFEVHNVIWNPDMLGNAAGVINIVERTAAARDGFGGKFRKAALIPESR